MGSWVGLQVCPVARIGTAGASRPSGAPLTYASCTPDLAASAEPGFEIACGPAPVLAAAPARSAVPGRAAGLPAGQGVSDAAVEGL